MTALNVTGASILIASDNPSDVALVQKLVGDNFGHINTSTNPGKALADFNRHQPAVLILAFNAIKKAEHYYLGLYRRGTTLHQQPHRTILLSNRDEMGQAYKLCREGLFDEYVCFWPILHDPFRLHMSIFVAQRDLATLSDVARLFRTNNYAIS